MGREEEVFDSSPNPGGAAMAGVESLSTLPSRKGSIQFSHNKHFS